MEETREYCAFISYRHKELDKYVAKRIHTMIERYTVPGEMREAWGDKKLGKVFRDEEELPVSSNLTDSICTALDHTQYLIVICTPDTPESIWVEREIKYFLEHHDRSHVVAVLAEGTPDTSFPKWLTTTYDADGNETGKIEPLAANLTDVNNKFQKSRMKKEAVRLYAAIMGCPFDSLWQREKRQKVNRMLALVSVLAAVALFYGISIYYKNEEIEKQNNEIKKQNEEIKKQNDEIKEKSTQIELQNEEIKKQYDDITEKNRELKINEAEALLNEGKLLYDKSNYSKSIECALQVIRTEEGRELFSDEAEYLLSKSLGVERYNNTMRTVSVLEQEDIIDGLLLSEDKSRVYTIDTKGFLRCFSIEDETLLWRTDSKIKYNYYAATIKQRIVEMPEYESIICSGPDAVSAVSTIDGSLLWCYEYGGLFTADFSVLSKDKKTVAVISGQGNGGGDNGKFVILNTADGSVKKEIPIRDEFGGNTLLAAGYCQGTFTDDGKKLFCMMYYNNAFISETAACLFYVDLEKEEINVIKVEHEGEEVKDRGVVSFVMGVDYYAEKDFVIIGYYDAWNKTVRVEEYNGDGTYRGEYQSNGADRDIGIEFGYYYDMPSRDYSSEYLVTYKRKGDIFLISCGAFSLTCDMAKEAVRTRTIDSGSYILNMWTPDFTKDYEAFLTTDGCQHYFSNGLTVNEFNDKQQLKLLKITEDYAEYEEGTLQFKINDEAVEAVVSQMEPKCVYILRPDKDSSYEKVSWCDEKEYQGTDDLELKYMGNGVMSLWELRTSDKSVHLSVIDLARGEKKAEYDITTSDEDDNIDPSGMMRGGILWPDEKHITYRIGQSAMYIYDAEKKTGEFAFKGNTNMITGFSVLHDGNVIHACINKADELSLADAKYILRWRINAGEEKFVECPSGLEFTRKADGSNKVYMKVSDTGLICAVMWSAENGQADSYMIVDTSDGSSSVIKIDSPEEYTTLNKSDFPEVVLSKESGLMFVTGKNLMIKRYDLKDGKVTGVVDISSDIDNYKDIADLMFYDHGRKIAIWTTTSRLHIYDMIECKKICERMYDNLRSDASADVIEDEERDRIFFVLDNGPAMCVSTKTYNKLADFYGFSGFCPETNEIFILNNDFLYFKEDTAILKVKAYTLNDLIEKASR